MDYSKIKDLAKKATEKTEDGISSMNEMRKKQKFQLGPLRFERQSTGNTI